MGGWKHKQGKIKKPANVPQRAGFFNTKSTGRDYPVNGNLMPAVNKAEKEKFNKPVKKVHELNDAAKLALIRNATPALAKNAGALSVYNTIVMYYNNKAGYAWPGHSKMAESFGVTPRTITNAVSFLLEAGLIVCIGGGANGKAKQYAPVFSHTISDQERLTILRQIDESIYDAIKEGRRIEDCFPVFEFPEIVDSMLYSRCKYAETTPVDVLRAAYAESRDLEADSVDYDEIDLALKEPESLPVACNKKRVAALRRFILDWLSEDGFLQGKFSPPAISK